MGPLAPAIRRVQDLNDGPPVINLAARLEGAAVDPNQALNGVVESECRGVGVVLQGSEFYVDPAAFQLSPLNLVLSKVMELQKSGSPMPACLAHAMIMLCGVHRVCYLPRCVEWAGVLCVVFVCVCVCTLQ